MENEATSDIQEVYYLENLEQLQAISDPIRYSMVVMLALAPMTGAQLARALDISRARAHYHLKLLEKAGLVQFYGEDHTSGIIEKYYRAIGRMFDFTHLLPSENQEPLSREVTLRTLKAVSNFIVTMLDVSRKDFMNGREKANVEAGFYFNFESVLKPDQYASVKAELNTIKNQIIRMTHENELVQDEHRDSLEKFRMTMFLTTLENTEEDQKASASDSE
jgi:DNA-binding transcriptional ArsR family regulator